jgi:hypothetical protein
MYSIPYALCWKHITCVYVYCSGFTVLDPGKGVCADPLERVTILEVEGPAPQVGSVSI